MSKRQTFGDLVSPSPWYIELWQKDFTPPPDMKNGKKRREYEDSASNLPRVCSVLDANGEEICALYYDVGPAVFPLADVDMQDFANATIIQYAPKMLALLTQIVREAEQNGDVMQRNGARVSDDALRKAIRLVDEFDHPAT